jgi:hypothetical protein
MTKRPNLILQLQSLPLDERVDMVRSIAKSAYRDAVHMLGMSALLEASPSLSYKPVKDLRIQTHLVTLALVDRMVVMAERAAAGIRYADDRHTRVAMVLLDEPAVADHVAEFGNAKSLGISRKAFGHYASDQTRKLIEHHRNKRIAHQALPTPGQPSPFLDEVQRLSGRMVMVWAQLAVGAGVEVDRSELESKVHYERAQAFWRAILG